jgi:hypothetical protein
MRRPLRAAPAGPAADLARNKTMITVVVFRTVGTALQSWLAQRLDLLPKPYHRVFVVASLVLAGMLIAGLVYPPAQLHALSTLWDVVVTSTVIWFLLESRGEDFRNQLWLRKNIKYYQTTIQGLQSVAANNSSFAVAVPTELQRQLDSAPSRSERRAASKAVVEIARRMAQSDDEPSRAHAMHPDYVAKFLDYVRYAQRVMSESETELDQVVRRFPELRAATRGYANGCRNYAETIAWDPGPTWPLRDQAIFQNRRHKLAQLGAIGMQVCDVCSDLLAAGEVISD